MKIIDAATVSVDAAWTEPTTNQDATPLTDLAYSSVYYKVGNGPTIVGAKVSATKPTGGGNVTTTLIIPAPSGKVTALSFQASDTDLSGNEGALTPAVLITVERLAPSVPANFTVA